MQANVTGVLSNNLLIATYLWALYNPLRLWHISSDTRGQTVKTIWEQRGCKHNDFFTWFLQSNIENTKITRSSLLYSSAVTILGCRTDLCKAFWFAVAQFLQWKMATLLPQTRSAVWIKLLKPYLWFCLQLVRVVGTADSCGSGRHSAFHTLLECWCAEVAVWAGNYGAVDSDPSMISLKRALVRLATMWAVIPRADPAWL